ncbi:MAG: hypothetical protein WBC04_02985 [Candidatus Acidiferrales bacterium]
MKQLMKRLWREEEGQDLTEYALLLVLLVLAAIGSLSAVATAINGVFANAVVKLQSLRHGGGAVLKDAHRIYDEISELSLSAVKRAILRTVCSAV